jgi:EAL domain-containing protein (putative c-di-GMP-specific phosphodiesterase class I)
MILPRPERCEHDALYHRANYDTFANELQRAFERGEFVLFYQPQVRLEDERLTGAEALIRWKHPTRGLLPPAAFLPALEAGVLAEPVGQWVMDAACAQAVLWRERLPDFGMSVNLFAAQFRKGDLPDLVAEVLARHRLPPEALELEITENIMLDQQERVLAQLEQLRRLGVALSFDDFGTGFASLTMLRTFPVTQIKIDKSFTQLMETSAKDRVIVTGLIDMARRLDLHVVAEGIETQASADFLGAHGCHKGQGYLFGKPVPAALFAELLSPEGPARQRA